MEKKLVKIDWIDSACSNSWWTFGDEEKELEKITPISITSVGYVIKEADTYICLAQNIGDEPDQFCNVITIPKGCIEKMTTLE